MRYRRSFTVAIAVLLISVVAEPLSARSLPLQGSPAVSVSVAVDHSIGAVNERLIGTNQPVPGAAPIVAPLGVDWERADMSLDTSYSCSSRTWDPTVADSRVRMDLAMGGEPELIVDYSPSCMTSDPLHETLDPPDAGGYSLWRSLVEEATYHEMTTYGVRIFEVWNEPDGTFWHGTLADYLAMYRATAEAILAAASRAGVSNVLVGGPALLFADPAWLEPFLEYVSVNRLPLGFVSWHYYGNYPALGPFSTQAGTLPPEIPGAEGYWYNPATDAQTYGLQVEQVKGEIARFPRLHPLTVIDEWNLDAGYDPRADRPYDAAFAAAVLSAVQAAGLDRMAFFRIADDAPGTLANWGMLYSDLRPKPVYWTFAFWHDLAGAQLATSVDPVGGTVGAIASAGSDGTLRVLVRDYVPYGRSGPEAVTVKFPGLGHGKWTYTVRLVDAGGSDTVVENGTLTPPHETISLLMPTESVALVHLQPAPRKDR